MIIKVSFTKRTMDLIFLKRILKIDKKAKRLDARIQKLYRRIK